MHAFHCARAAGAVLVCLRLVRNVYRKFARPSCGVASAEVRINDENITKVSKDVGPDS